MLISKKWLLLLVSVVSSSSSSSSGVLALAVYALVATSTSKYYDSISISIF